MAKVRLDVLLVERGLANSRSLAQRLVMAGQVRADGQVLIKPADKVDEKAALTIDQGPKYVSRGGEKLEAALTAFGLTELQGRVCADVGDGILHWKIRQDQRVTVMERTNARNVARLPQPVDFATADASFISLKILLPVIRGWFADYGTVVALIKSQFEAGRQDAARGEGVIRDPAVHRKVLQDVLTAASAGGYGPRGLIRSPLLGPKGNTEFLAWLELLPQQTIDVGEAIDSLFGTLV